MHSHTHIISWKGDFAHGLFFHCAVHFSACAHGTLSIPVCIPGQAGDWVLLENVHLAPRWLAELEKRIHSLQLENGIQNNAFRLFLAAEIHPDLPPSLLSRSRLLVFEQPPGVKVGEYTLVPKEIFFRLSPFPSCGLSDTSPLTISHPRQANLLHTFSVVSTASRLEKPPAERSRMHMLLAWLHAVIQERLIFAPLGLGYCST